MSVVLPAPLGPEVAEGAPPGDEELDAVDGDGVAEALGQPMGLDGPVAITGLVMGGIGQRGGCHPLVNLL